MAFTGTQILSRLLKNYSTCHSEGGVCPRNLFFSWLFEESRFLAPLGMTLNTAFFGKLLGVFSVSKEANLAGAASSHL